MCHLYFGSQEIDSRHVTGHRSIDYSRNSCRMCHFCHAQLLEITDAANIKSTLVQHSCRNAEVVEAFCRVATSRSNTCQSRLPSTSAPALNLHSARCSASAQLPATSCLGAFRPPPSECVERPSLRRPKTCTGADIAVLFSLYSVSPFHLWADSVKNRIQSAVREFVVLRDRPL